MKTLSEVVLSVGRVDRLELRSWVERGWVVASREGETELHFSEIDVARVELICDLRHDMMVDEETLPLVLSLLDQVYALAPPDEGFDRCDRAATRSRAPRDPGPAETA